MQLDIYSLLVSTNETKDLDDSLYIDVVKDALQKSGDVSQNDIDRIEINKRVTTSIGLNFDREALREEPGEMASEIVFFDFSSIPYYTISTKKFKLYVASVFRSRQLNNKNGSLLFFIPLCLSNDSLFSGAIESYVQDANEQGNKISLYFIANTHEAFFVGKDGIKDLELMPDYIDTLNSALNEHPLQSLNKKCILRIGHNPEKARNKCRSISYFFDQCDEEFKLLLTEKLLTEWKILTKHEKWIIIYETPNCPDMKDAIQALCFEQPNISSIPYESILRLEQDDRQAYFLDKKPVLILDFIHTASKAIEIITLLHNNNINLFSKILSALHFTDASPLNLSCNDIIYEVSSFVKKEISGEEDGDNCIQCKIKLDETEFGTDSLKCFRAFDMFQMCKTTINKIEPNNEKSFGRENIFIPDFDSIINSYGSWIAFKTKRLIDGIYMQGNNRGLHLVMPNETQSNLFAQKIYYSFNGELSVIRITRETLNKVQKNTGAIDKELYSNLLSIPQESPIVILDIFNVTNTTGETIATILTNLKYDVRMYLTLVDFFPYSFSTSFKSIPKKTLYAWYNRDKNHIPDKYNKTQGISILEGDIDTKLWFLAHDSERSCFYNALMRDFIFTMENMSKEQYRNFWVKHLGSESAKCSAQSEDEISHLLHAYSELQRAIG